MKAKSLYLAGKIAAQDWRCNVVEGLAALQTFEGQIDLEEWPMLSASIFGRFDYAGPYFTARGNPEEDYDTLKPEIARLPHGALSSYFTGHFWIDTEAVVRRCFRAIDNADLVFAWMSHGDQYGTLIELGYAAARSKRIVLGWPCTEQDGAGVTTPAIDALQQEMWFLQAIPDTRSFYLTTPEEGLRTALEEVGFFHDFESPLEEDFWRAWHRGPRRDELAVQVNVLGGRYRLDFAHLATRTAIECDGISYHANEAAFEKDRRRDRELTAEGWATVRFTGNEIRTDVERCVRSVEDIIRTRTKA